MHDSLLARSETLGKIFKFSVSQTPFLWNGASNSTYHMGLL